MNDKGTMEARGLPVARRAVFAGLGLACGTAIVQAMGLDVCFPHEAMASQLGQWIRFKTSNNHNGMQQVSDYRITSSGRGNYHIEVRTTLTSKNFPVYWTTTKTLYCNGSRVAYIGPDYSRGYLITQSTSFDVSGGGKYHITSKEEAFREPVLVYAGWDFWIYCPYIIISSSGPGGSISPLGTVEVEAGSSKGYSMTPGSGNHIHDVQVDGNSVGPKGSYTFSNVQSDHTIHVTFGTVCNVTFHLLDTDGDRHLVYTVEIPIPIPSGDPDEVIEWPRIRNGDSYCQTAMAGIRDLYRKDGFSIDKAVDAWFVGSPSGSRLVTYEVHGDCEFWAKIKIGAVFFLADGTELSDVVFEKRKIPVGNTYRFPQQAYDAGKVDYNNLNANFRHKEATAYFAYFTDEALKNQVSSVYVGEPKIYKVYGRNRNTLRTQYADDSLTTEDRDEMAAQGVVWHTEPDKDSPIYSRPFELPDFTGTDTHSVQGSSGTITLPPIGDDGPAHKAYYYDERCHMSVPAVIYGDVGDGRWRTFRCDAWTTSGAPRDRSASSGAMGGKGANSYPMHGDVSNDFTMTEDTIRYIRWYEVVNDGVVSH